MIICIRLLKNTVMSKQDIVAIVDKISCRCLIVCGENDQAKLDSAKLINECLPQSRLVIIADAGHEVNVDKAELLWQEILSFVE